ncbi:hypothetical protein C4D60_Mb06t32750 [Musa balbisiana]|uniref:BZIP domain-containing protein n=1 Tax=Musa balbisiana TaxID=52838 RepID=A0A4S8IUV0_MUSBA|nr:hypothetical protein C4D60_Mb06t32750 [Musa balbisiana]
MKSNEATTPSRANKGSSPVKEPLANPPYPEWAAMQAYFGAGMMPPPYFSTAVAPSHAPHPYMWGPQPLVPPFGSPYGAIYPHGGVYTHPSVPLGSHTHFQGISPSPATSEAVVISSLSLSHSLTTTADVQLATPLSVEMPAKLSKHKDKSLVKKLKGLDGLALSGGNGIIEDRDQADGNSGYNSTEGSSDGSNGDNAEGGTKDQRRQRSEDGPSSDKAKVSERVKPGHTEETGTSSKVAAGVPGTPVITAKPVGTVLSSVPAPEMDIRVSSANKVKGIGTPVPPATGAVDERELKRERRKQSNRESARRSRLRKQAETEELALKVESLSADNTNLRSEISRLKENSDKLRLENSALTDKLKNVQSSHFGKMKSVRIPPLVAENFLSMIENQNSARTAPQEGDTSDQSGGKLHQLLNTSPRRDAVAAS